MKGKFKEDEKNEKIIRSLSKFPYNRRCINCNSLGPQYVCTNFWTFVCATCSGIHREFTHRVKSVSMSTFTSEEVTGLRGGGNELAKEVYLKEWDPRQSVPDNCNAEGLRRFIKHVYVDRRYTGEKGTVDGHLTPKKVEREDSSTHRNGLRSKPWLDIYEQLRNERSGSGRRSDERDSGNSSDEGRNLENGKEARKHDDRRISTYFEVVDDRFRDNIPETTETEANFYFNRQYNLHRPSNQHKALDSFKPREVCSLREILNRIPSVRLSEAFKEDVGRPTDGSTHMQMNASSIKKRFIDVYPMEPRKLNSMGYEKNTPGSAINVSSNPKPASRAKQSPKSAGQSISNTGSSPHSNNPVSTDSLTQGNHSKTASNKKNLNAVVPAAKPMASVSTKPSTAGVLAAEIPNMPRTPSSNGVSPAAPLSNSLTSSPTSTSPNPRYSVNSAFTLTTSHGGLSSSPNLQSSQFVTQQIPHVSSGAVKKSLPSVHKLIEEKEFQEVHGTGPAVMSYSGPSEQKSGERNELPQNLFAATCSSAPVQSHGWQVLQANVTGYGLQYSPTVKVPTLYRPVNTFDLKNKVHLQSPMLSHMASWHGAQSNLLASTTLSQSSSFDSPSTQWIQSQLSPYEAVPFQPLPSTLAMPLALRSDMGQQQSPNRPSPTGFQGVEILGNNPAVFSGLNPSQHYPDGIFSAPAIQTSSYSVGRNPFV